MTFIKYMAIVLGVVVLMAGCNNSVNNKENGSGQSNGKELTVYAAAHLTEAFNEMEQAFEKQTGIHTKVSYAGTQILRTQIEQGAPADVFASANLSHMKAIEKQGFTDEYKTFAYNTMALIVPKSNPAGIQRLKDLKDKNLRLVIGVDNVPVGIYARQVLDKANQAYGSDFKKEVLSEVVSLETDVKKVVGKVTMGEADAGFVYVTDLTKEVRKKVKTIDISKKLNVRATDTIAVINNGDHPQSAQKWIDFVHSDQGQNILEDHNLIKATEVKK
ncbi:molybdate ABC transporter substrate-binding protein [Tuberibacillus sp. Marseille-P3662]|uniref:molybdate ABC transporter substrate-binding protein n=1 Tax=Tuberibacillus sp. Marseille-P3662 TaxID=1965358 RepID=UPI000A1C8459|nr:molybdate ABC transporter substrate-binding protein [Tuberibacillus sp. Marseille-P3662]